MNKKILISIVIHNQAKMVYQLLENLLSIKTEHELKIILRVNTPENIDVLKDLFSDPRLSIVFNITPLGFGANHNLNFNLNKCDFFIVLNPDIELITRNFDLMLRHFNIKSVGIVAPKVLDKNKNLEDSIRTYPTIINLIKRYTYQYKKELNRPDNINYKIDWCAGMFMVFSSETFSKIDGFDEKYYMYLEDADICLRLRYCEKKLIKYEPLFECIHNAQRASRRELKALKMHLISLIKFQLSYFYIKYLKY